MKEIVAMVSILLTLGCIEQNVPGDSNRLTSEDNDGLIVPVLAGRDGQNTAMTSAGGFNSGKDPLWRITSAANTGLAAAKTVTNHRHAKPQGPFSVHYVLENWAPDDYRLVVELQTRRQMQNWRVEMPSVTNFQEVTNRVYTPESNSRPLRGTKVFKFRGLPDSSNLIFTVKLKLPTGYVTKTYSIEIKAKVVQETPVCSRRSSECVQILPGVISIED